MEQRQEHYYANMVCIAVNAAEQEDFSGEIHHHFSDEGLPFATLLEMLMKLEALYDGWAFPESAWRIRSFKRDGTEASKAEPEKTLLMLESVERRRELEEKRGELGSFFLRTKYRQRASWQGTCLHRESGQRFSFQSVLQLLLWMEEELRGETAAAGRREAEGRLWNRAEKL